MKKTIAIVFLLAITTALSAAWNTSTPRPMAPNSLRVGVEDGDTIYYAYLHEVYVYPPMKFKNKSQEKFYWRTVRDVKRTLPIAKLLVNDMIYADSQLALLEFDKKAKRKWWHQYERQLYRKYEKEFRSMYASQGRMLMKLLDRESDKTSYQLIQQYKGHAAANFWQMIAKLFKNDLKEDYDGNDKDRIVERVINLVEAGQL